MAKTYSTPGVYIEEKSAFPSSAVPVATAVPAFIGYTEIAMRDQKHLLNVPTRISSFGEYVLYFGEGPTTIYDIVVAGAAADGDAPKKPTPAAGAPPYTLKTSGDRFLLYYAIKHFFANGGSDCYIVSIGDYAVAKPALKDFNDEKEDKNTKEIVLKGIQTLKKEPEPTMIVIPEAVLLEETATVKECSALQQLMLLHCSQMLNRVAILDVYMDEEATTKPNTGDIAKTFRTNIGNNHLMWGAAYYPWLQTSIVGSESVSFLNISEKSRKKELVNLLIAEVDANLALGQDAKRGADIKAEIQKLKTVAEADEKTLHLTLMAISPMYKAIMGNIREKLNLLPPSAAMAGIYSMVDNQIGVFQSPANVSVGSVVKPLVNLTNEDQEDLNVPLDGKAINAIRTFPGKGILVWGARTLDGNSQDWRYISVRRTVIFIEQSIKFAAEPYVFKPNTSATWTNVRAMITNFLTNVWQSGALAGSTPEEAFSVQVGLGSTMTPVDILDGYMKVTVLIAVTRPAEFIVLTFQQQMQQS